MDLSVAFIKRSSDELRSLGKGDVDLWCHEVIR